MCLLILGGTADGRKLAQALHQQSIPVIYSVAGLVRLPNVDCPVISGGFTQYGGLLPYIQSQKITAILDATHPYAQKMSATAVRVAKAQGIPCWRFHRKPWQPQAGDIWHNFTTWDEVLVALKPKASVFLTAGQIPQTVVDALAEHVGQRHILRTAVKPTLNLPPSFTWIKAIGPFQFEDELNTMQAYGIDALVCKNSGGDSIIEKLNVSRQLAIPVFMMTRPEIPKADKILSTHNACYRYVVEQFTE